MRGLQKRIFGDEHILTMPVNAFGLDDLLLESKEIVQRAIIDEQPYAVGLMLSGGDDSITALHAALMLGVRIDFIMHGVTGTGLKDVRKFVHETAEKTGIKLYEANAGTAFEDYVNRKGFFGVGDIAHKYSYHILKAGPFRTAISKYIRKKQLNRRLILLNGVRVEESDTRADNYGDNPYRDDAFNNLWVNIIHWWTKKDCLELLTGGGIVRNPVSLHLGRSGECNCGTMQNETSRMLCAEYDKEWGVWMHDLRRHIISRFGWDINQNPNKKIIAEMKAATDKLSNDMPMCVGCKSRGVQSLIQFGE